MMDNAGTSAEGVVQAVRRAAVIVAAGKGLRAGTDVPKQYLPLGGRPMLCRSVETFLRAGADPVVLVVPAGDEDYVREEILPQMKLADAVAADHAAPLITPREIADRIIIVPGGAERHASVYEGLMACADSD